MKKNANKEIGIIGGGLAPYFNESMANQILLLSKKIGAHVITCNDIGWTVFKKCDEYLIINTKFLINKSPFLSFVNGLILYAIIKLYENKFKTIIIPGGIESEFLRHLNSEKCVPIITSIPILSDDAIDRIKTLAPKLKRIIVQSRKTEKQLIDIGIDPNKIILIYPLVDLKKFKYSDPPPMNEFQVLFASSPNLQVKGENNFRDKGVSLLLNAFKVFIKGGEAKLCIIWRGKYTKELFYEINKLNLESHVEIVDEVVDMSAMYAKTHVTVIPYLNLHRSPEIPLSALESLACGRPIVATDVGEVSEIVKQYNSGCVTRPSAKELCLALVECRKNYILYQKNCRLAAEELSGSDISRTAAEHPDARIGACKVPPRF